MHETLERRVLLSTTLTVVGTIYGTGNLTKTGAGTLTLTGGNTYTGTTTVADGTVEVNNGGWGRSPRVVAHLFHDINGNGTQESKEPNLDGWPVVVRHRDGNGVVQESVFHTGSDGTNSASVLSTDSVVSVTPGAAKRWRVSATTIGSLMSGGALVGDVDLSAAGVRYDIGVTQRASISGLIVNDLNQNGAFDTGEPSIRGWQVYTDDNDNGQLDAGERVVRANSSGRWTFASLPGGYSYNIRMISQQGLAQTYPANDAAVSVFVAKGQAIKGRLLGVHGAAASGLVFNDLDGDGVRTSEEDGLAGWRVWDDLDNDAKFDATEPNTLSSADGSWLMADLPAGKHKIRIETRTGWPATVGASGHEIDFSLGESVTDLNFGKRGVLITGHVFEDSDGNHTRGRTGEQIYTGQSVYLDKNNNKALDAGEPVSLTNSRGRYRFSDQPAGTYTVRLKSTLLDVQNTFGGEFRKFLTGPDNTDNVYTITAATGQTFVNKDFGIQESVKVKATLFWDKDVDGVRDELERSQTNGEWTVYDDENGNKKFDTGEPSKVVFGEGDFNLAVRPGVINLRVQAVEHGFTNDVGAAVNVTNHLSNGQVTTNIPLVIATLRLSTFNDLNRNAIFDGIDHNFDNAHYFDADDDGVQDDNELSIGPATDLLPGHYIVRPRVDGMLMPSKAGSDRYEFTIKPGQKLTHAFALMPNAVVFGSFFADFDQDGSDDGNGLTILDDELPGFRVYIDLNNNGQRDASDPLAATEGTFWQFEGLAPGSYVIRAQVPQGFAFTTPSSAQVTLVKGGNVGPGFGVRRVLG